MAWGGVGHCRSIAVIAVVMAPGLWLIGAVFQPGARC